MTPPADLHVASAADTARPPAALDIRGVTASYGATSVLFSVDFALPVGAMGVIVGPNGAGK